MTKSVRQFALASPLWLLRGIVPPWSTGTSICTHANIIGRQGGPTAVNQSNIYLFVCKGYRMRIFIYYPRQGGYVIVVVCLFVCLLATLRKNFRTDLHEIFREGWQWAIEQKIKFWWGSWSRIPIRIRIRGRRALAETPAVPVLIVIILFWLLRCFCRTIRWTILTCAQKLTSSQLSLPHGTKQKRIMKKLKQT